MSAYICYFLFTLRSVITACQLLLVVKALHILQQPGEGRGSHWGHSPARRDLPARLAVRGNMSAVFFQHQHQQLEASVCVCSCGGRGGSTGRRSFYSSVQNHLQNNFLHSTFALSLSRRWRSTLTITGLTHTQHTHTHPVMIPVCAISGRLCCSQRLILPVTGRFYEP